MAEYRNHRYLRPKIQTSVKHVSHGMIVSSIFNDFLCELTNGHATYDLQPTQCLLDLVIGAHRMSLGPRPHAVRKSGLRTQNVKTM